MATAVWRVAHVSTICYACEFSSFVHHSNFNKQPFRYINIHESVRGSNSYANPRILLPHAIVHVLARKITTTERTMPMPSIGFFRTIPFMMYWNAEQYGDSRQKKIIMKTTNNISASAQYFPELTLEIIRSYVKWGMASFRCYGNSDPCVIWNFHLFLAHQ